LFGTAREWSLFSAASLTQPKKETILTHHSAVNGLIVVFESTEDIAGASGSESFRAIRANVALDPLHFCKWSPRAAPAPGISQDGSRIAFALEGQSAGN